MRAVAILAVLPEYRSNFVAELRQSIARSDDELVLVAGDVHLDSTVKSAEFDGVIRVRNKALLRRRLLWQVDARRYARNADVVVLDLNPRSITAWTILLERKIRRRRTLLWGHILPRQGAGATTAPLRRWMRGLADGVISYTWSDAKRVRDENPDEKVWVAANGLYPIARLGHDQRDQRDRILYVGRLEPSKKPMLSVEGFALARRELGMPDNARLTLVGDGSEMSELKKQALALGINDRVDFLGHVSDFAALRTLYSEAAISISPGYVGLSLTQSLGFGVPMLVADDEPHAPEVELLTPQSGKTFRANDAGALAFEMVQVFTAPQTWDHGAIVQAVRDTYSSTAMAEGFEMALRNMGQEWKK